ncbi:MAG TPA: TIGR02206 family membrane protein [Haliangium sp.]|nr:TIGR02206 family membrane protein [Haliangium sp.]
MFAKIGEPFVLFGPAHLWALVIVAVVSVAFPLWMRKQSPVWQQRVAFGMAFLLLTYRMYGPFVYHHYDNVRLIDGLPFQICGMLALVNAYMLWRRSYRVYEVAYFMSLSAAVQPLITPDVFYGLPHITFLLSTISHGILVMSATYATFVFGFRPTWRSVVITFVASNIYMLLLFPVNMLLGTNFMYVMHRPATASLLDHMGPWPVYIFVGELFGLAFFLFWYIPWAFRDWLRGRQVWRIDAVRTRLPARYLDETSTTM